MTNPNDGTREPSLFQARNTRHDHQHLHNHQHRRLHSHSHQSLEEEEKDTNKKLHHIRSPHNHNNKLHERQVVIVQTVSVIQYIDATGALVSVSTLYSNSPSPIDLPAGVTAGLTALETPLPSVSLPGLTFDSSDGAPSSTVSATDNTGGSSSTSSTLQSASLETLTSTPSSSAPAFPIISSGVFNTTSTRLPPPTLFTNSTLGIFSNSTRASSTLFRSSSTFSSTVTKSSSSSTRLTSTTSSAPTIFIGGGDGSNAGAGSPTAVPSPEVTTPPGPGLTPEARNAVVGGVVGSVAGIAIVALVLMFFLKWRKQQGRGIMLLGDGDSTARGRGFGLKGSSGGDGEITERSTPFIVPAALARLTGKRAIEQPPASPVPEEKGFYRVSGRKLRSVLESGGDGYSDPEPNPHNSISGTSYYRDSQAFLDNTNLPSLQLGSPMRPESGVLVFREGPQRTPVQEQAPFPLGHRPSAFPNMLQVPDPLGRSITTETGSRTSNSRFTEDS